MSSPIMSKFRLIYINEFDAIDLVLSIVVMMTMDVKQF